MIEKRLNIQYGDSQQAAIEEAIKSPLFILTGGRNRENNCYQWDCLVVCGTKWPFIRSQRLYAGDVSNLASAPTGRAAKRMNETTGLPASTIHRLLGLTGREKIRV